MTPVPASVPDAYLGVWKRTLLRTPEFEDTTSTVFWLQTPLWHGDIRIPVSRPPCTGRRSLHDCTREELFGLSEQQGFAGVTRVEEDICRWLRRVDFQPPSGFDDVGRIEFEGPERMLEYGVQQDYFEIWERLPGSTGEVHVEVEFREGEDVDVSRPVRVVLATGRYFIHVRPRLMTLPQAAHLTELTTGDASLRSALDFEISFGTRSAASWTILHSTLPWLERTVVHRP